MTISITNELLLQATFGDMWQYAHVCSFPDDPSNISNDRKGLCWSGDYYNRYRLQPGTNQFFCISLFAEEEGKSRRRKKNFSGTYVIGLDDVREKLSPAQAERLPVPTYKLKSSMFSEQWFYVLKVPETNRNRVDNLLDQLIANGLAPDGKDPGMKGVTRYLRLPEGYNTKASRVRENNGTAPACELIEWKPENKYTMEELAIPFDCDLDAPRADVRTTGAIEMNNHPVLKQLNVKSMLSGGRYDITCPWVDEHSDNDDSGSAIFTNDDGSFGFQCHHGHCQERTARDVVKVINDRVPGFESELKLWKSIKTFEDLPRVTPDFMGSITLTKSSRKKLSFKNSDFSNLQYVKWVLNGISPEGFLCFAGLPGIGKSSVLCALSMVVAGFGEAIASKVSADRDRIVVYVSEDTEQLERQFYGYCQKYQIDAEQLQSRIRLVDARRCSLEELAPQLSSLVTEIKSQCTDPPLLILDTASSLFDLDNENDNSQVAKFIAEIKHQIYELLNCTIWLITHAAKTTSRDSSDITPRGASAFMGDVTGTGSICEQDGKKVFSLGKTRVTPDFTEIMFESCLEHFLTKDDRDQSQRQSIWLLVPTPSNSQMRKEIAKQERENQDSVLIEQQVLQVISYLERQRDEHGAVTIKTGSGGSQKLPSHINAKKLNWKDVLTDVLEKSPQTNDEKRIKALVIEWFIPDNGSVNGWHVWSSTVPKVTKGLPSVTTVGSSDLMVRREEH